MKLSSPGRDTLQPWLVVLLAAATQGINQIDKAVIGLAAEPIMRDLSLSTEEYGFAAGAIYALFAVGGISIGLLAARFRPRSILIALLLLWSLSQFPIVLAASFPVLVACRVVLGVAEGGGTATCLNICHEWFPETRRAIPGAVVMIGGTVGIMLTAPALTYVISAYGWRAAFLACGLLGLAFTLIWLTVRRDGGFSAPPMVQEVQVVSVSLLGRLLVDRTILGIILVGLSAYWIVGFMIAWLAPYVRDQAGYSMISSGWVLSGVYLAQSLVVVAVAATSQRLLAVGHSSRVALAHVIATAMLGSAACFLGLAFVTTPTIRLVLITMGTALPGSVFSLCAAMISEVVPPRERNRVITIVLALMTVSALVSPGIAGRMIVLGQENGWFSALLLIAVVGACGAVVAALMLMPALTSAKFRQPS